MNYDKYIGLPYLENGRTEAGIDCWGLARVFYREQLNIDLPSYTEEYSGGHDPAVIEAISRYKENWEKTETPTIGDLCLFNILGEPTHVGIFVGNNKFLHSREGRDSVIETLDNTKWKNRFQGFYKYTTKPQVQVIGAPHPLKVSAFQDWTAAGTTVEDAVTFIKQKYTVGKRLSEKMVVMVDGIVIPQKDWSNTVLQENQQVSYKAIAGGRDAVRMLLVIALIVVTIEFGPKVGSFIGTETGLFAAGSTTAKVVGAVLVNMAGQALINAIAPIRPNNQNDPGSAQSLNLFTGASNQANRFGAIPVVLGKVRFTGLLGATPYVETLTNTSILNTAIVWGFGPLDVSQICIGGSPIEDFYGGLPDTAPRPVTLTGLAEESTADFDKLYGKDVEQQYFNLELVNNITDGNPWREVSLAQDCDAIDIAFTFPEGMRKINTKTGAVSQTTCQLEIQTRPYSLLPWDTTNATTSLGVFKLGDADAVTLDPEAYTSILTPPYDPDYQVALWRYTTFCLSPNGGITRFDGAVTDRYGDKADVGLQARFSNVSYTSLLGVDKTWDYMPSIPGGYLPLYTVSQSGSGIVVEESNLLSGYTGKRGLSYSIVAVEQADSSNNYLDSQTKKIKIEAGKVYAQSSTPVVQGVEKEIWTTRGANVEADIVSNQVRIATRSDNIWGDFLKTYGIWAGSATSIGVTGTPWTYTKSGISFADAGVYSFEAAADDEGEIYIDGILLITIPKYGYKNTITETMKLTAGNHTITIVGRNSGGGDSGIGLRVTYTPNGKLNIPATPNNIITYGTEGVSKLRKDAFNDVYSIENLPRKRYQVRVRRLNSDLTEDETDQHKYHRAIFVNVTGFDSQESPMENPPGCYLAKTAVRIQSTNKMNGNVDGINALVQTRTWDWDRTANKWVFRATNNPASLFGYVLMHQANAFRITDLNNIDVAGLQEWHNFCNPIPVVTNAGSLVVNKYYTIKEVGSTDWTLYGASSNTVGEGFYATGAGTGSGKVEYAPKYTYNSIITNTQSVMDTLRDICAAGLASPTYIDGKWGVIIDRPRTHTVQHFTPHNSWGFEASKTLPILPHAFRISIADENLAYQVREIIVYNYGYGPKTENGKKAAELFEQLSLPGVTNPDQAVRLARWHFAQIKLRPEVYGINVDFEHLVCTRGDLVKVTHDVPSWGIASGRLKSGVGDAITGTTLTLTEKVYLDSTKSYKILIRTNKLSSTVGSGSVTKTLTSVTTGYTDTITLDSALVAGDNVLSDNLFMLGEVNKESQQCIVIGIEPSTNYSAKLTLVDYGVSTNPSNPYNIFTDDLSGLLVYNPNVATVNTDLIKNSITSSPIIKGVTSSSALSEQVSKGNYQNVAIVSFANDANLPAIVSKVQFDIVLGNASFDESNPNTTYITNKETSSYTFTGLTTGFMYKLKARYTDSSGKVCGPWSTVFTFTNAGKDTNPNAAPSISLDLEKTYIVVDPVSITKPNNFQAFVYRLYKSSGTADLWDTTPLLEVQSNGQGKFDLLNIATPRISETGIDYLVACRILDKTNNYSEASTLAAIKVKTIV
jgi:sulfur carrier protein ThiS